MSWQLFLQDALVQICPTGTVLNPFTGSSTTGLAP